MLGSECLGNEVSYIFSLFSLFSSLSLSLSLCVCVCVCVCVCLCEVCVVCYSCVRTLLSVNVLPKSPSPSIFVHSFVVIRTPLGRPPVPEVVTAKAQCPLNSWAPGTGPACVCV